MELFYRDRIKSSGVYSLIFKQPNIDRVYKLFKNIYFDNNSIYWSNKNRVLNFQSEIEAYEIAMTYPELKSKVPEYFGKSLISAVYDYDGNDISNKFLLDCCYSIDYISEFDSEKPIYKVSSTVTPALNQLRKMFYSKNINYIDDASVIFHDDIERIKIIDFATRDVLIESRT